MTTPEWITLTIGACSLFGGLVWLGLVHWRTSRTRFRIYAGSLLAFFLAVTLVENSSSSFFALVVGLPIAVFALAQIPLAVFLNPKQGAPPGVLLFLAFFAMFSLGAPAADSASLRWLQTGAFTIAFSAFFALVASWLLLLEAAWRVGRWWAVGLNPITLPAVLPAFVLKHPGEAWRPARRFLVCLAIVSVSFLAHVLAGPDPVEPIGFVLFSAGGLAAMGTLTWLLVASVRAAIRPASTEEPASARWAAAKVAALGSGVALTVYGVGLLLQSDVIVDRHAATSGARSRADLLFGCGDSAKLALEMLAFGKQQRARALDMILLIPQKPPPAPVAEDYDSRVAAALAQASLRAYMSSCDILDTAKRVAGVQARVIPLGFGAPGRIGPNGKDCDDVPGRDQAVIIANSTDVIVAFRGTDQRADWGTNLSFVPANVLASEFTQPGFEDALDELWQPLQQELRDAHDKGRSIWLTGHSLGGALAVVAALRLLDEGVPVRGVYTFGQPPAVNEARARALDGRIDNYYRFVLHRDVVPGLGVALTHAGKRRYIDTLGRVHADDDWVLRLRDVECSGPFSTIETHSMIYYLTAVEIAGHRALGANTPQTPR